MAKYWTTVREQTWTFIGELMTAVVNLHLKGLYVGPPLDGYPFGVQGVAVPIYRTTPKGRIDPRYIHIHERELRGHCGERGIETLVASKIKQFLTECPKGWVKIKEREPMKQHGGNTTW